MKEVSKGSPTPVAVKLGRESAKDVIVADLLNNVGTKGSMSILARAIACSPANERQIRGYV